MEKSKALTRRAFSVRAAMLVLGGAVITISEGCGGGGGGSSSTAATPLVSGDKAGNISGNHGHVATITAAQITAGNALTLDITGVATHAHSVVLSATEIVSIRNGGRVTKTSSVDDTHDHDVTFN